MIIIRIQLLIIIININNTSLHVGSLKQLTALKAPLLKGPWGMELSLEFYIYIYIYAYVCIYIYIYTYIHIDR